MDISKLADQLAFLMEADRLKNLYRQTYTSTDDLPPMPEGSSVSEPYPRRENDAEHSFSLALFTAVLAEYSNEPIDVLKTIKTVLIHDIVEIDAGDTYCYDSAGNSTKAEREKAAADRLFALLPSEQEKEFRGLWELPKQNLPPPWTKCSPFCSICTGTVFPGKNTVSGSVRWKSARREFPAVRKSCTAIFTKSFSKRGTAEYFPIEYRR